MAAVVPTTGNHPQEFKLLEESNSNASHFTKFAFTLLLEIDAKNDIFHQFLQFERANENLEFRREVFKFKQIPIQDKSKIAKTAKAIWDEFGKEDSRNCINIPSHIREKLEHKITENKFEHSMFDQAVKEVDTMLVQGPFPRFGSRICETVQESWDKITSKMSSSEVGKILFMNWFMRDPEVMPMFKRDMAKHGAMLVSMIETAVGLLNDLKSLVPKLAKVGVRHGTYGALPIHFSSLEGALLVTLQELLEDEYNSEIEVAWKTIFQMMTSVMNAAIAHAQETKSVSSAGGSERSARPYTELDTLLEAIHKHPKLMDAFECYYNPEDIALRGEFFHFHELVSEGKHNDSQLLGKARSIFDNYISDTATTKVRLTPSVKLAIENRLRTATTAPEVYDVFEDAWAKLDSRMEKRPFPIFKESIGIEVQNSWDALSEKLSKDKIGKILFMNFFQSHPEAMALFNMDMMKHGAMLAGLMEASVHALGNVKDMIRNLNILGRRHTKYGAKPEWFPDFGIALTQTFQDCLRERFTDEAKNAWEMMFLFISSVMVISYTKHLELDNSDTDSTGSGSKHSGGSGKSAASSQKSSRMTVEHFDSPMSSPKNGHSSKPSPSSDTSRLLSSPSADSRQGRQTRKPKSSRDDKCVIS